MIQKFRIEWDGEYVRPVANPEESCSLDWCEGCQEFGECKVAELLWRWVHFGEIPYQFLRGEEK